MAKKKEPQTIEEKLQNALVPNWEQPYKLPENWCWTKLGEVCLFENGFAFKSTDYKECGIPLLRISNIQNNQIDFTDCVYIDKEVNERYLVNSGDLLIALSGATTGKNGVYQFDKPAYLNQRVGNLKVVNEKIITKRFRNYYIEEKTEEILKNAYGGAQPNISPKDLSAFFFPLPPLAEQKRIVDRIESLFSKLDEAKELAQNALDSFENRKSAILHKAFTGELTKKWREENGLINNNYVNYIEKVLTTLNNKDYKNIKNELLKVEEYGIDNWLSLTIGAVGIVSNGSTPSRRVDDYWNGNIPWISSGEVRNCIINSTKECITELGFENSSVKMLPPKTVLVAMIGEGKTRGQSALLNIAATINQNIAAIQLFEEICLPEIMIYWLRKTYEDNRTKGGGTGPQALNCQKVRELKFVLPPLSEQQEIVRILDSIFAKETEAKELVSVIDKIDLIKKSILSKAFRGELGTNDVSETSSVELLKEILEGK